MVVSKEMLKAAREREQATKDRERLELASVYEKGYIDGCDDARRDYEEIRASEAATILNKHKKEYHK